MEIGSISSNGTDGSVNQVNVRLQKGQSDQLEQVVGKLLSSIEAPQTAETTIPGKGQRLNVTA